MNVILLLAEIIVVFSTVLFVNRLFGKTGLTVWVAVASIAANIFTAKTSTFFGFDAALGTVLFASNFLATDILCENYGEKYAKRAVVIGVCSILFFTISAQVALLYTPSSHDYAHDAMQTLFALNLRISISSAVMYFIANLLDVYLYQAIRKKTGSRLLWVRNNVATILCNCLENFAFILIAFYGVYSFAECIEIAVVTSVIETVIAICDTPFLYAARKWKTKANTLAAA